MASETVTRRWTLATWLVAGAAGEVESIAAALDGAAADVVALQSVREHDVEEIAAALGANHEWALSHYPRSRLFPGTAVGLALLSPHRVDGAADVVISASRSTWSRKRRIAQAATVARADHSAYAIGHSVAPARDGLPFTTPTGGAPAITIRPAQVGVDVGRAIALPDDASVVTSETTQPIDGVAPLLTVTFEMAWVSGDFPV